MRGVTVDQALRALHSSDKRDASEFISQANGNLAKAKSENAALRTHAEALAGNLEEAIRILTFAFEGALPEETVMGLTIDPYGTVNDMRTALIAYREGK